MSTIERPQAEKSYSNRQDHGTRGNVLNSDWYKEHKVEVKGAADRAAEAVDITEGLDEYHIPSVDVSEFEQEFEEVSEIENLIGRYPDWNDLNDNMHDRMRDYDNKWLDIDDLASFYAGFLAWKHNQKVSINDAHILLDELLHDRYSSVIDDELREDEAHDLNEKVNKVVRGEDWVTTDLDRPTHRTRNRNLVRMVENLVDPQDKK